MESTKSFLNKGELHRGHGENYKGLEMIKIKELIRICFLSCFLLTGTLSIFHDSHSVCAMPQEKIETVILKREPSGISPKTLTVKLGTTIVWLNAGQEPITLQFIDKLGVACKAPVNFHSDLFGHYETNLIEKGETASICFIFNGTYSYEVRRLIPQEQADPVEEIAMGTIITTE